MKSKQFIFFILLLLTSGSFSVQAQNPSDPFLQINDLIQLRCFLFGKYSRSPPPLLLHPTWPINKRRIGILHYHFPSEPYTCNSQKYHSDSFWFENQSQLRFYLGPKVHIVVMIVMRKPQTVAYSYFHQTKKHLECLEISSIRMTSKS